MSISYKTEQKLHFGPKGKKDNQEGKAASRSPTSGRGSFPKEVARGYGRTHYPLAESGLSLGCPNCFGVGVGVSEIADAT